MVTGPPPAGAGRAGVPWTHRLRPLQVHKMWLVMCVAALLVLAQYRVSSSWLAGLRPPPADGVLDSNDVGVPGPGPGSAGARVKTEDSYTAAPTTVTLSVLEEAVRMSVERLAQNNEMAANVGARLLREVASQLQLQVQLAATCGPATEPQAEQLPGRAPPWPNLETVYIITPTYRRPEQIAELTRMAQTLLLVRNVHWLVIEDAKTPSKHIGQLLKDSGLRYEHLTAAMPEQYRKKRGAKPKGVAQRNRGLQWLRANAVKGVFYFADDDNTYDVSIFEEIRTTKRVSMFPVGLCTKYGLSTPVVSGAGAFLGFYDGWVGGRKFPVDMAGFAVSVKFLHERPKAQMPFVPGFEEDGFLRSLAPFEPQDVELRADNCTKVLVWHTQTKANAPSLPLDGAKYNHTNLAILKTIIV